MGPRDVQAFEVYTWKVRSGNLYLWHTAQEGSYAAAQQLFRVLPNACRQIVILMGKSRRKGQTGHTCHCNSQEHARPIGVQRLIQRRTVKRRLACHAVAVVSTCNQPQLVIEDPPDLAEGLVQD